VNGCGVPVGAGREPPLLFRRARLACRGERRTPDQGRPQDTPTIETIVLLTFYEVISIDPVKKGKALKNF